MDILYNLEDPVVIVAIDVKSSIKLNTSIYYCQIFKIYIQLKTWFNSLNVIISSKLRKNSH